MKRVVVAVLMTVLVVSGLVVGGPAPAAQAGTVKVKLRKAVTQLKLAPERRAGYDRDAFPHWVDDDGDCQDTRVEVLVQEARTPVSGCRVTAGRWRSYYDRVTHRVASGLDIDHLVPLAEAWDSGARSWSTDTRRRFANDLGDRRSLVAVTAGVNRSKSDRDPAEWLPQFGTCRYVREWVAVKVRWSLRVDRAEKRALRREAAGCKNVRLKVTKARLSSGGASDEPKGGGLPGGSYPPASLYHCPKHAPIKGNESSMIYHPPSSPWYDQTTPEQCFATERAALAAGFRRASY